MKTGTMPRKEVEQWALAVIKVGDTLSPDRLVKRGEVADMCGVHPTGADRIIEWARMVRHRGEPLPFITMPGVVRAMKAQRERYMARIDEWVNAQAQSEAIRAAEARFAATRAGPDYLRPTALANLVHPHAFVPALADLPDPVDGTRATWKQGVYKLLRTMAERKFRPRPMQSVTVCFRVSEGVVRHAERCCLVSVDGHSVVHITAYGLLAHAAHSGPDKWANPADAVDTMQRAVRNVGQGKRAISQVVPRGALRHSARYIRALELSGMIKVIRGNMYITRHCHQFARMDLTTQG